MDIRSQFCVFKSNQFNLIEIAFDVRVLASQSKSDVPNQKFFYFSVQTFKD